MANARAKYTITAEDKTRNAIRGVRKNFKGLDDQVGFLKTALVGFSVAGVASIIKQSVRAIR